MQTFIASAKIGLTKIRDRLAALRADEAGAALIEYALVVGLMAVIAVAAVAKLNTPLKNAFTNIGSSVTNNTGAVAKGAVG